LPVDEYGATRVFAARRLSVWWNDAICERFHRSPFNVAEKLP
jgi:hypothetical protein